MYPFHVVTAFKSHHFCGIFLLNLQKSFTDKLSVNDFCRENEKSSVIIMFFIPSVLRIAPFFFFSFFGGWGGGNQLFATVIRRSL